MWTVAVCERGYIRVIDNEGRVIADRIANYQIAKFFAALGVCLEGEVE